MSSANSASTASAAAAAAASCGILRSEEYLGFRSAVAHRRVVVDDDDSLEWSMYDAGPRHVRCPLVCLPPCSGTAEVFFRQVLYLTSFGFRVIALDYPVVWSLGDWCLSFQRLLDHLSLARVHIFGASLGGFLAQKFAEQEHGRARRVASLVLCNSFVETSIFQQTNSLLAAASCSAPLNASALGDREIADSMLFLNHSLHSLSQQQQLASRLTLNCQDDYVFDDNALTSRVREETYKCYPDAKRAHLKSGGNFPYLSRASEIHLQPFLNSPLSPPPTTRSIRPRLRLC
uniref:Maspardin n=1 Tax=Macrostomum lignano TaxID=282301 RepID=A0A1I8GDC3_9PLAT